MNHYEITTVSIEAEFPGWELFRGVDRRWHARLRGADMPVMVHGDDLVDLREEIVRKVSKIQEMAWREGPSLRSNWPEDQIPYLTQSGIEPRFSDGK